MNIALAIAVFLAGADPARPIGLTERTLERLEEGAVMARQKSAADALAHDLKLIEDVGDEWAPTPGGRTLRTVRDVVLRRIATDSRLRAEYRLRFEESAAARLRIAGPSHDFETLAQLARDRWPTRAAAAATDLLADLLAERGDLARARHLWAQLIARESADDGLDVARVRAKRIIAGRWLGEFIDRELAELRQKHPEATGPLAGREGKLVDIVESVVSAPDQPMRRVEPAAAQTFAVDPARAGVIRQTLLLRGARRLEPDVSWPGPDFDESPLPSTRMPPFHPIFWKGRLIVASDDRVVAIDFATGKPIDADRVAATQPGAGHFSLSSDDRRLVARLNASTIVSLAVDSEGDSWQWRREWTLGASVLGSGVTFESCPVLAEGRMWLSWVATVESRAVLHVGCFDAARPGQGPLWQRAVAELPGSLDGRRNRLTMVTRAAGLIVVGTDAGLVVAVDAGSGRPEWAVRYQSRGPRGLTFDLMPSPRDVCPPVYDAGRVFVAPDDIDELIAIDAWTGDMLWDRPPVLEAVHLVGVIDHRLIVSARGQLHGLGAVHAASGRIDQNWGSLVAPPPAGRPLIVGETVLYPTQEHGILLWTREGRPAVSPSAFRQLPLGNLAFDQGRLAVVGHDRIIRVALDGTRPAGPVRPRVLAAIPPKQVPAITSLSPSWSVDLPTDETPLRVTATRVYSAKGKQLIARELPSGNRLVSYSLTFAPLAMDGDRIIGEDEAVQIDEARLTVPPRQIAPHPLTDQFDSAATGQLFEASAGPGRKLLGTTVNDWAWAENGSATHRWSGRLVEVATGRVVDRVLIPAHGPRVVFGVDGSTLIIAVPGSAKGFTAP